MNEVIRYLQTAEISADEAHQIFGAVKAAREAASRRAIREFRIGQIVSFTGRQGRKITGTISELRKKNAVVCEQRQGLPNLMWRVPAAMLAGEAQ